MSVQYEMKQGGGVTLKREHIVAQRRMLTDDLRAHVRREQRRQIVDSLAELTGLPFDLAITNIEWWHEHETVPNEWENFKYDHDEQPIALLTTCRVRRVEHPVATDAQVPLLDSNPANT